MVDSSQSCELPCYTWIMYNPDTVEYPDKTLHLGNHLGSAIDAEILKYNDKEVYRSMYWPLTLEDMADIQLQLDMQSFKEATKEGLRAKPKHNSCFFWNS